MRQWSVTTWGGEFPSNERAWMKLRTWCGHLSDFSDHAEMLREIWTILTYPDGLSCRRQVASCRCNVNLKPHDTECNLYIKVRNIDVWPVSECRTAGMPGPTTMSRCQVTVSRMARVGTASTPHTAVFDVRYSVRLALRPRPTARANVDTVHVLFHSAVLLPSTGRVWPHWPAFFITGQSGRTGRSYPSPTVEPVEPGRFATPTSRAFHICINGVSGSDVQSKIICFS